MAQYPQSTTLLDILSEQTQSQPHQRAYTFLGDGETESDYLTYQTLWEKANSIAAAVQPYQGERALLLYPAGLEFITAFLGCLLAGVVAVPVYPPLRNQKLSRLLAIIHNSGATVALTPETVYTNIQTHWTEEAALRQLHWVLTDLTSTPQKAANLPQITPDTLAFLQYTSGSTGNPKGVMVSHGNLMDNLEIIYQCFGHSPHSQGMIWLPPYHDMGLIGGVLQPIYGGFPVVLMPAVAFLKKPLRWLQAISKYHATTSGGPNFAYDLCVQKVKSEQLENLDLSSWDLAFTGSEPIRSTTLEQFAQKFAPCGFRLRSFYPCYGMAETTLLATGGLKTQEPIIYQNPVLGNQPFVGCGKPWQEHELQIINPDNLQVCQDGEEGEIWISGNSVGQGYWNNLQLTQETFGAIILGMGNKKFLRTGDLGFMIEGELFITGRCKDVLIIRGKNHYPQDIERTVQQSHVALVANGGAAFLVEGKGQEQLIIVQEVERTYRRKINVKNVVETIKEAVASQHGLYVYRVVLVLPNTVPKTSSGKIQRWACRTAFLENQLVSIQPSAISQSVTS